MNIIVLILLGVLIWSAQMGFTRGLVIFTISASVRVRIRKFLPAVGAALWLAYAWLAAYVLFGSEPYYPWLIIGFIVLIGALFGWYVLRDVAAGLSFRIRNPEVLDHTVELAGVEGRVVRLGTTHIHVRTDTGETVSFPYSTIAGEKIIDHSHTYLSDRYSITIGMRADADPDAVAAELRASALLLPWINLHTPPRVKVTNEGGQRSAEVIFHCLNEHYAALIEQRLRAAHDHSPA